MFPSFSFMFLLFTLRISLTRLLTSAMPWLINTHTIFWTCFPCFWPLHLKQKYFMLRIKSAAHQAVFSCLTAAVEWYVSFWFGIFPHESFVLLSYLGHRRTPVPERLEQWQCIGKDENDTACYRMDCLTERLKTPQRQLRGRSWAKVHKKEMPDCRKPVMSPACFCLQQRK